MCCSICRDKVSVAKRERRPTRQSADQGPGLPITTKYLRLNQPTVASECGGGRKVKDRD